MSYILDALKKSEQERGRGSTPGVQTIHSASINYHNQKKTYWPYILIAAVILNLVAIIYFMIEKDDGQKPVEIVQPGDAVILKDKEPEKANTARVIQNPAERMNNVTTEPMEPAIEKDTTAADTSYDSIATGITSSEAIEIKQTAPIEQPYSQDIIDFDALPESTKRQLPAIIISAHIYSSNPTQRNIVINDKFLEEGEYIMDDLVLQAITPDGAILNYQGTLFRYGAISSWQ